MGFAVSSPERVGVSDGWKTLGPSSHIQENVRLAKDDDDPRRLVPIPIDPIHEQKPIHTP